jgi:hypothetical protein
VDYVDEQKELGESTTATSDPTPVDAVSTAPDQSDASSFLASMLPPDVNMRRRVVIALLRSVLADRKIT